MGSKKPTEPPWQVYQAQPQGQVLNFVSSTTKLAFFPMEISGKIKKLDLRFLNEDGKLKAYFDTNGEGARNCYVTVELFGSNPKLSDPTSDNPADHGIVKKIASLHEDEPRPAGQARFRCYLDFGYITRIEDQLGPSASVVVQLRAQG